MDRRWFPARKCKRDDTLGIWPCVALAAGPAAPALEPASTAVQQDRRSAHRPPGALAGDGHLRHAVLGVGRDREELSRHRRDRGRQARPRGDRPQYRAARDGRRAHHLQRHAWRCPARSSSSTRCTISPWSPTIRGSIGDDTGARRDVRHQGAPPGRRRVGRRASAAIPRSCRSAPRSRASIRSRSRCRARCVSATAISRRSIW